MDLESLDSLKNIYGGARIFDSESWTPYILKSSIYCLRKCKFKVIPNFSQKNIKIIFSGKSTKPPFLTIL